MKKTSTLFLVAFLTLVFNSAAWSVWLKEDYISQDAVNEKTVQFIQQLTALSPLITETALNTGSDKFRIIIPKSNWEPIFFEAINERTHNSNLSNLRLKALPQGNLEIRVWRGFGVSLLEGFILRRNGGQWSAMDLGWKTFKDRHGKQQVMPLDQKLDIPASGWETVWRKLTQAGILILPNAAEINCSAMVNDGMSYVVEYNLENTYRTYMYDNPDYAKCNEAKQMIKINKIISNEFYKGNLNLTE